MTPSQTIGPFFHYAIARNEALGCLAGPDAKGERIRLRIRVVDGDGALVPDAMIELWQADAAGIYNHPADVRHAAADPDFFGFGRLATGERGDCVFHTVKPGRVPDGNGALQAAHINVSVFARGLLDRLSTRIYFAGDPALAEDAAVSLVPEERRQTLLAQPVNGSSGDWEFTVRLQGEGETVFFDV